MIVNPIVDVYTKTRHHQKTLLKHSKKPKKQQSTENQKNTKYRNITQGVPGLTFSLPEGVVRTPDTYQLRNWCHVMGGATFGACSSVIRSHSQ